MYSLQHPLAIKSSTKFLIRNAVEAHANLTLIHTLTNMSIITIIIMITNMNTSMITITIISMIISMNTERKRKRREVTVILMDMVIRMAMDTATKT